MSPSRKSSAQRRKPYTPEEKRELLARAANLLVAGNSEYSVAKKIGVQPRTLKKWRREKRAGFQEIREAVDARSAIREIGNLREEVRAQEYRTDRLELLSASAVIMGAIAVLFSIFS